MCYHHRQCSELLFYLELEGSEISQAKITVCTCHHYKRCIFKRFEFIHERSKFVMLFGSND